MTGKLINGVAYSFDPPVIPAAKSFRIDPPMVLDPKKQYVFVTIDGQTTIGEVDGDTAVLPNGERIPMTNQKPQP